MKKQENTYKIAFVGNTAWSMYNFRMGIIRKFKNLGYEVTVIAPRDAFSSKIISAGFSYIPIKMDNYATDWWGELWTILRFVRIYRREKYDFIFHYTIKPNIYGGIAAAICGIPAIAVTTGLGRMMEMRGLGRWLVFLLYRQACRMAKEVWFLNEEDKAVFMKEKLVNAEKTRLLPGEGVDLKWFRPKGRKRSQAQLLTFLYAGRLLWQKGVGEFVQAAQKVKSQHPKVVFQLLGFLDPSNPDSVPYEEVLEWQQKGWVNYLGEATDVRPFLERVDCVVLPSYYREGLSRILLEAAAMERPIITTDNVGCRDLVEDGVNGFLVAPRDAEALSSAFLKVAAMTNAERKKMGHHSRALVQQKYSQERVFTHYLEVMEENAKNN